MTMAQRVAKSKAPAFFVDENCHPQNIAVLHTRAKPLGIQLIVDSPDNLQADQVFGAIFQYPGTNGIVRDFSNIITKLHDHKAIGVIIADPLALCILTEPGAMGADIAVGNTQRFGVPLGFGGRTPPISLVAKIMPVPCPAAWLVSLKTVVVVLPIGCRYKRANNIFDGKRPHQMCVPPRHYWR